MKDTQQYALKNFLRREIYVCQTLLISFLLDKKIFSWEDVEHSYPSFDAALLSPAVCHSCKRRGDVLDSTTGECKECFDRHNKRQDIVEWWSVSAFLAQQLKIKAQPLLENEYGVWWGRTCTGQEIDKDDVIQDIYIELSSS